MPEIGGWSGVPCGGRASAAGRAAGSRLWATPADVTGVQW